MARMWVDVMRRSGDKLEMKLGELRSEIQQSAKSAYGEKLYPITSDWIPVTDVLAIVDRFERQLRGQFDSVLATARSQSKKEIEELLLRIVSNLLP
jgi:hypothetical protein